MGGEARIWTHLSDCQGWVFSITSHKVPCLTETCTGYDGKRVKAASLIAWTSRPSGLVRGEGVGRGTRHCSWEGVYRQTEEPGQRHRRMKGLSAFGKLQVVRHD